MTNETLKNKKRPIRLLLIEDNHGDALLLKRAFTRTKIKTSLTIANTGEEALHLILKKNYIPDIILLDLNLPGINGLEVLKSLKNNEDFKRIPVIVLSSSRAEHDVINCYNQHANCYLTKASNLEELYTLVEKIESFWFNQVIFPDEETKKYGD